MARKPSVAITERDKEIRSQFDRLQNEGLKGSLIVDTLARSYHLAKRTIENIVYRKSRAE